MTLDEVLVTPSSRYGLFSLKAWDGSGGSFTGCDGTIFLLDGNLNFAILAEALMSDRLPCDSGIFSRQ